MNKYFFSLSSLTVLVIFSVNIAQASPTNWGKLTSIQQNVLKSHELEWDHYDEVKQKYLLQQSKKEITGLKSYKDWFYKKLTAKERAQFYKNKKTMTAKNFRKYVDSLMEKYGKARH